MSPFVYFHVKVVHVFSFFTADATVGEQLGHKYLVMMRAAAVCSKEPESSLALQHTRALSDKLIADAISDMTADEQQVLTVPAESKRFARTAVAVMRQYLMTAVPGPGPQDGASNAAAVTVSAIGAVVTASETPSIAAARADIDGSASTETVPVDRNPSCAMP